MRVQPADVVSVLDTFIASVDTIRMHSSGHPRVSEAFESAWREVRRVVLAADGLPLEEASGSLTAAGLSLDGAPSALKFAIWMSERCLRRIVLTRDTTPADFRNLLDLFVRSASDALIAGSLRPAIAESMPSIEMVGAERAEDAPTSPSSGYLTGNLLERSLDLPTLDEIQAREGVEGASRLQILARGKPERFLTVVYWSDRVGVEVVHLSKPFREAGPGEQQVERLEAERPIAELEAAGIASWSEIRTRARATGPCAATETLTPEVRFRHQLLFVPGVVLDVLWEDPNPADDPEAWDLVDHYLQLLDLFGLPFELEAAATPATPAPLEALTDLAAASTAVAGRWGGLELASLVEAPFLAYVDPADRPKLAALDRQRLEDAVRSYLALIATLPPG